MKAWILLGLLFTACSSNNKTQNPEIVKAELYYSHGTQKLIDKDYNGALDLLMKAYKLAPEESQINNNLGMAYYLRGDEGKAFYYIRKAIKIDAKNTDAKNNLASLHFNRKNYEEAKKLYHKVLKDLVYRNQFRTYYNLGIIAIKQRNRTEAIKNFKLSLKENIDYCPASYNLGLLYRETKQIKKAIKTLHEGTKGICYGEAASHYLLGLSYLNDQQLAKAKNTFQYIADNFTDSNYYALATQQLGELESSESGNSDPNSKFYHSRNNKKNKYNNKEGWELDNDDPLTPKF